MRSTPLRVTRSTRTTTKSAARKTTAAQMSGHRRAATLMTVPSTPGRADMPSGMPRKMSAMRARTTTARTAMASGAATGTAAVRTMMTICGQQICGESAACMPGHLAEGGVEDMRHVMCPSHTYTTCTQRSPVSLCQTVCKCIIP